jgi:hypothetical protein
MLKNIGNLPKVANTIVERTLVMNTHPLTEMMLLLKASTALTSAGKLTIANFKNIIRITARNIQST